MKKHFSFQQKVLLLLVLLMNLPFLLTGYMAKSLMETTIMREKDAKLLAFTHILDARLDSGGYEAILRRHGAENASREKKIAVLNEELRGITDDVASSAPGLGIGYYSKDIDAILTYGPSSSFEQAVGLVIPPDHPGRIVMDTNKEMIRSGTMVRGDILNAMHPIVRDNKVIGYIWANELTTDVMTQLRDMVRNLFLAMLLCFVLTVSLLVAMSRRTVRDVDRIIRGVRSMRFDLGHRIENMGGELGEVASSINTMAEDIDKATQESGRAMAVLQSVLGNVDATVFVCDPATKHLVYVNEYLRDLLAAKGVQIEDQSLCYEVLYGQTEPCTFCIHRQLYEPDGTPKLTPMRREIHIPILGRDFLVTDRLITWHDGRLLHMEMGTDITERNALEAAEAANLAQRDFLSRMSHELRTPMNGVLGMTHLAMQANPPPTQLKYLKKIQSSASLLLGIINDILDFSRIEAGRITMEKAPFELPVLVENIRELILPRTQEQHLDFNITLDDSVPRYAVGDELRLSQVLLNILGNAAKFTSRGSISLHMSATPLLSGNVRLRCTVEDTGIGMTEEQQARLFKPFSQADISTSRKFGGTGLGLSISKALVELMGGTILVVSKQGQGSLFTFDVELVPLDELPITRSELSRQWEHARYDGLRFLVVEDNSLNQEIAVAILGELGARVDVAENGEEGLRAFMHEDYDLILMDVRMPIMDGMEATRRIRASGKHDAATVPIVAMTANAMNEDRVASKEAGMNGHVAKPIDLNELKSTLFKLLNTN
ncbi:ATP-binding protein [Desulfobulbus sp.]|uniref:ATP-binding protein n=1 Tax=Desulfobulbus sp. TaxID=895 RepID=UPI00286F3FB9|nr:ATP-binding protein [Desulfobulbus sp.]